VAADLAFASALCRTGNSNTVTLVKYGMLIGQGVAQTRRDRASKLAVQIATDCGHDITNAVACSDSFFPFIDGVEPLVKKGVRAIFSTSGAQRDEEVRAFCSAYGVALFQAPDRTHRMFCWH
jgi:AICAR transformylase/IMP cyclohydrolase PurH